MADKKLDHVIQKITDIYLDSIKKIASRGHKLNSRSLFELVSENPEAQKVLETLSTVKSVPSDAVAKPPIAEGGNVPEDEFMELSRNYEETKYEFERIQVQKEKLLKQLALMEDHDEESDRFYNRIILTFTDLLRNSGNRNMDLQIRQFKELIRKKAGKELIEKGFESLRAQALSETPDDREDKVKSARGKAMGFLGKWIKSESTPEDGSREVLDYTVQFKETYQDIVDELKRVLNQEYFDQLSVIETSIYSAGDLNDFYTLRKSILGLLQDYIASVSTDREQATKFIRDISQKLVDVESYMLGSLSIVDSGLSSNETFSHAIARNIKDLRTDVDACTTLELMHQSVIGKISLISDVLEKKKKEDVVNRKQADKQILIMKKSMQLMKKDFAEASKRAELLEKELRLDPLTGAENRRSYEKRIAEEMARYLRYKRPFSVIIMDVDHFKKVNDTYGHAVGDICLKEIIARVKPLIRTVDMLARFGGEEFVLLLPETEKDGGIGVAEKIRSAVESIKFIHREETVTITISLGITQVLETDKAFETIFKRMDKALYEAKNSGRNRVVFK